MDKARFDRFVELFEEFVLDDSKPYREKKSLFVGSVNSVALEEFVNWFGGEVDDDGSEPDMFDDDSEIE